RARTADPDRPGRGRRALPERAERADHLRIPRDRDVHGAAGNTRLLRAPGPPRGLRDRRLGTAVRAVRAWRPVLDRLRVPAPSAGSAGDAGGPGRSGQPMPLARGTERLESARLVLRRMAPDALPFYARIHALPAVAQHLYPGGRPRSPDETARWLR